LPESIQVVRQLPLRAALVDVRVPAADVDETEPVLVAQQLADARGFGGEAFRVDRAAARLLAVGGEFLRQQLAQEFAADGQQASRGADARRTSTRSVRSGAHRTVPCRRS